MQLEVGASLLSLSCDESCNGPLSMIRGLRIVEKGLALLSVWDLGPPFTPHESQKSLEITPYSK